MARAGIATVFPQAIGLAAMWDAPLLHRIAVAISDEARAKHHEYLRQDDRGIYKGLTIWSPNITPDHDTGIGGWTADQFDRAMRRGVDDEGANLYPAFPYPWFSRLTRADNGVNRLVFGPKHMHLASWPARPGLARPSTSWGGLNKDVDARNKSAHDDSFSMV